MLCVLIFFLLCVVLRDSYLDVVFFFFKQKTAYELRISDWSSDVCSSDLRNAWLEQAKDDRHPFRFIVSAEDGADYEDLKPLTRRLMTRMEEDLGTKLDWVAVDHFNTGHPHTHIIARGFEAVAVNDDTA